MNLKKVVGMLAVAAAFMSCEKENAVQPNPTPNPNNPTFTSGSTATFRINGATQVQQSAGFGFSCSDTSGTTWALATGNNVSWDPNTRTLAAGPNDTMLALIWKTPTASIGSYTIASQEDAFCFIDIPGTMFRQYDATGITINIVRLTTDSIFGDYSGTLRVISGFQLDPSGNLVPIFSGAVDTVSTTFGVKRNPC
jgi:hypothetical protein